MNTASTRLGFIAASMLLVLTAALPAGAFSVAPSTASLERAVAGDQFQLVKRGGGKGHNARGKGRGGKASRHRGNFNKHFRKYKLRRLASHRWRVTSRKARLDVARVPVQPVFGLGPFFGSQTRVGSNPDSENRLSQPGYTLNPYDVSAGSGYVDPQLRETAPRESEIIPGSGEISCERANAVIEGYAFSDPVAEVCDGPMYVFRASRDTKLYLVKIRSRDGELASVSKLSSGN